MHDYPNNAALTSVINAIDANKADKADIPRIDTTLNAAGAAADAKAVGQAIENIELTPGPKGDSGVYVGASAPTDASVNVWINPNGEAIDLPTGGSGGNDGGAFHFTLILEEDVSNVILKLPVKWGKIVQFNLNCIPILNGETNVEMYNGGWNYKVLGTCSSETKAINLYGVHYVTFDERRLFTSGLAIASNAADCCWPTLPQSHFGVHPDCEEIRIYTKAEGVVFQASTKFDMWGVYTE